jgi:hypothetical protein
MNRERMQALTREPTVRAGASLMVARSFDDPSLADFMLQVRRAASGERMEVEDWDTLACLTLIALSEQEEPHGN